MKSLFGLTRRDKNYVICYEFKQSPYTKASQIIGCAG
jgi:hypothetical protein